MRESSDSGNVLAFPLQFALVDNSVFNGRCVDQRFKRHEVDGDVVADYGPTDGFRVFKEPLHTEPRGAFLGCLNGISDLPLDELWRDGRLFRRFIAVVELGE